MNVYLPEKWRNCNELSMLNIDGEWEKLDYTHTDDGISICRELRNGHPMYILIQ